MENMEIMVLPLLTLIYIFLNICTLALIEGLKKKPVCFSEEDLRT